MSKLLSVKNLQTLANYVVENGQEFDSERGKTYEVINANLHMTNPRDRIDTSRARKMNVAFAFAEFIAMVTGVDSLKYFTQFIPSYSQYSTDSEKLDGAYGSRITWDGNQIESIVELLTEKPESRRAVIAIYDVSDLVNFAGGLNTPCTLTLQFLVRNGKLDMITNMRSNDIHYGLTNDVVVFTMLQEMIADRLGIDMGTYYHNAGSLHVYSDAMEKFEKRHAETEESRWPHIMKKMNGALSFEGELVILQSLYISLQNDGAFDYYFEQLHSDYTRDIALCAKTFIERKDVQKAKSYYNKITDITLRRVMLPWIPAPKKEIVDG